MRSSKRPLRLATNPNPPPLFVSNGDPSPILAIVIIAGVAAVYGFIGGLVVGKVFL